MSNRYGIDRVISRSPHKFNYSNHCLLIRYTCDDGQPFVRTSRDRCFDTTLLGERSRWITGGLQE